MTHILDGVAHGSSGASGGFHLLDVLDRVREVDTDQCTTDGPYRRYLEQASYVQAVCWIAACLADAATSATCCLGLIHMDVEPSTYLIVGDGLQCLDLSPGT